MSSLEGVKCMNRVYDFLNKKLELIIWRLTYIRSFLRGYRNSKFSPQKDQSFLILGNGPSTASTDLLYYKQQGYKLMCVNFFAVKDERFWICQPDYYCIVDSGCLDKSINACYSSEIKKLFDAIEQVTWDMVLLCRADSAVAISNPHVKVIRLSRDIIDWPKVGDERIFQMYNKNKATCGYQNVISAALFYCIGVEAKEVLLTGVETDFHKELIVDEHNIVYRECKHFYGVEKLNLIEKGEIKKGELYKYFFFYYNTLRQYYTLSEYAKYNNVSIFNLCKASFIDVFEKRQAHLLEDK